MTTLTKLSTAGRNDFQRDTLCQFAGQFVITRGVAARGDEFVQAAIGRMVEYRYWTRDHHILGGPTPALVYVASGEQPPENGTQHYGQDADPWGEHDFGAFEVEGTRCFFKHDGPTPDAAARGRILAMGGKMREPQTFERGPRGGLVARPLRARCRSCGEVRPALQCVECDSYLCERCASAHDCDGRADAA